MENITALLLMDMQIAVLRGVDDAKEILQNASAAAQKARHLGIPVIFVKIEFRLGGPEISLNNKIFGRTKAHTSNPDMTQMMDFSPVLIPQPNDIIVVKKRLSAFAGSDLEIVLRSQKIQHLVLAGVSSSGVVLSTLREAADKDYSITVLSDCCGDSDLSLKQVLEEKVFPMQATVCKLSDWNGQL